MAAVTAAADTARNNGTPSIQASKKGPALCGIFFGQSIHGSGCPTADARILRGAVGIRAKREPHSSDPLLCGIAEVRLCGMVRAMHLALALALLLTPHPAPTDFKNFTYPLSGPLLGHTGIRWLNGSSRQIHLLNGNDGDAFSLESVKFADVDGDGRADAIVTLRYRTGGTQQTEYVYLYSLAGERPQLLGYFHAGDRADMGLRDAYGEHGLLVVEVFDPKKRTGDCCSTGYIRTRYRWLGRHFQKVGAPETGNLEIQDGPSQTP